MANSRPSVHFRRSTSDNRTQSSFCSRWRVILLSDRVRDGFFRSRLGVLGIPWVPDDLASSRLACGVRNRESGTCTVSTSNTEPQYDIQVPPYWRA